MSEQNQSLASLVGQSIGIEAARVIEPTIVDRCLVFIQEKQEARFQATLKELADHAFRQLYEKGLVQLVHQDDAETLLKALVFADQSFFRVPAGQAKEGISTWFTRSEGLPPLIADIVAFLTQKE